MAKRQLHIKRYLLTGLLTIVPLWLTWMVFKFVFGLLSEVSAPLVAGFVSVLGSTWPTTGELLGQPWLISLIAFVITLVSLYLVGFAANFVIGRRLIEGMENLIQRIPVVHSIYGGTKKLMSVLQNKPSGTQRVVLINFPSPEMKSIGFVTRADHAESNRRLSRDRSRRATHRHRLERRPGHGLPAFRRRSRCRNPAFRRRMARRAGK